MALSVTAYAVLGAALVVLAAYRILSRRSLSYMRGPPSNSWLFGHSVVFSEQWEVGSLEFEWEKQYGKTWRQMGCFGQEVLMVADPKALQHITYKASYNYPKTIVGRFVSRQIAGEGILFADATDHARHRKIMNPAFTAGQLRSFMPLFRRLATKFSRKWKEELRNATKDEDRVLNVHGWLARLTLDIIGEAAFDHQCGALDGETSELVNTYKNMFSESMLFPTKVTHLFRATWQYIPGPILKFIDYLPSREYKRFRTSLRTINAFSRKVIDEKTEACLAGKAENKKDIMSILVKANVSEDPKTRLNESEMTSQMATFMLAGHETTSSTLTWMLYELAKHSEFQQRMRDEVAAVRAKVSARGDSEFSIVDFDSMTHVLAAIKETLRYHPIAYLLARSSARDDVIPLAFPITTKSGDIMSEIPVSKGQEVLFSIATYNRIPEIWGADAAEWNPERFLEVDQSQQTTVGMWANLMSFSGGVRGCIGWRFSVLEMQAILVELLENFEFSIPADKPEIMRLPAGLMVPMVKDKMHLGTNMPIQITMLEKDS